MFKLTKQDYESLSDVEITTHVKKHLIDEGVCNSCLQILLMLARKKKVAGFHCLTCKAMRTAKLDEEGNWSCSFCQTFVGQEMLYQSMSEQIIHEKIKQQEDNANIISRSENQSIRPTETEGYRKHPDGRPDNNSGRTLATA